MQWHKRCSRWGVEFTASKINDWVKVDRKRKIRADRRGEFFAYVRKGVRRIFILLFIATICVFVHNHQTEIQTLASAKFHQVIKKHSAANGFGQTALNYQKQVDDITK